jgi:hypothetical protein
VYVWYPTQPAGYNWSSNTPVDIAGSTLTNTVIVNQKINPATWVLLGNAVFDSGTNGYVRVRNGGTSGFVCADAVRFVYSGPAPGPLSLRVAAESDAGTVVSWPTVWVSGSWGEGFGPANLTDGDTNTVWAGDLGGAPWRMTMDFGSAETFVEFTLLFAEAAWPHLALLGSADGVSWYDVLASGGEPFTARYIQVRMWSREGVEGVPVVREVQWGFEAGTP